MYGAVDIGGTKTLVVIFDDTKNILEQSKFPTPKNYDDFLTQLAQSVALFTTKSFRACGIGMRGNIDRERGLSLLDDVLGWGEVTIREDVAKIFNCHCVLENDSKLAGLSEARLVPEFSKVLYMTISTGIGTSFIIDGKLDPDTIDSEFGKSVYEHEGTIQQWEDFASGRAIVAKYGKRASEIEDPVVWEEISKNLAIGIVDAVAAFTPNLIILGGGVGSHYDKFKQPLSDWIKEITPAEIAFPEIRKAQHPEEAVIYGCYELAKDAYGKHR